MIDRFGEEIEDELPAEIEGQDEEPEGPPDEYMVAHCERCDDSGMMLNGLYRCDHVDYGAIAKRHRTAIKDALKKNSSA